MILKPVSSDIGFFQMINTLTESELFPVRRKYKTKNTCSQSIEFDLDNGIVSNVRFNGGCMGNTQGVAALVDGMKAEDVIRKCKNIQCGFRGTSCPDQLARALEEALAET